MRVNPIAFFKKLKWLDGGPLVIEPYRQNIFQKVLATYDESGRLFYTLALLLRGKKNNKSLDAILAMLFALITWKVPGGFTGRLIAFDEDQADQDLDLLKKLINVNPVLRDAIVVRQKDVSRKDGGGYARIIPGRDVLGSHGGTSDLDSFDEIHTHRDWKLLEALQPDPSKQCLTWITSYNSIFHRPGVPLFDLLKIAWAGTDKRMFFSYYASDKTTDPDFADKTPEERANPSMATWQNQNYLETQKLRTPSHVYRRLHLNLPGSPEGAAFNAEKVMDAIERGTRVRLRDPSVRYFSFVDMSGGSSDSAVLAISHKALDGRAVLDLLVDQGPPPPFDPNRAVLKFAAILKEWGLSSVSGDNFAGNTFQSAFQNAGISYVVSDLPKSAIYEAAEPLLNAGNLVLLDLPELESQTLGLVWRGGRIDHPAGPNEHDDWPNSALGCLRLALHGACDLSSLWAGGTRDTSAGALLHSAAFSTQKGWW